jgi:hypothetical protein
VQIFDFAMSKLEKRDHKDIYPLTKQEEIQIKRQRNYIFMTCINSY